MDWERDPTGRGIARLPVSTENHAYRVQNPIDVRFSKSRQARKPNSNAVRAVRIRLSPLSRVLSLPRSSSRSRIAVMESAENRRSDDSTRRIDVARFRRVPVERLMCLQYLSA